MTKKRTVLISGAGSETGIGFAAAQKFTELNYQVFITAASARIVDRATEIGATAFVADLTDTKQVSQLIENVIQTFGGLDVLVNNAGMTSVDSPMDENESKSVFDVDYEKWQFEIMRNLDTAFLLTKAALPLLRKSGSGRIINVSSVTGPVMAMKGDAAYAAAKAGLVGLTRSLALDEAKFAITANALSPGWISTGSQTKDESAQGQRTPLGRSGTAQEVATTICWLADAQNGYLTGQNILVDGGNSIAEERL
jgi:3-oxoacyl-[acyl-carrier protein] reductase